MGVRRAIRNAGRPFAAAAFLLRGACAAVVAAGCARAPTLAPLAPDAVILAFGDSLTSGAGAEHTESYPAVLQALTGRTVANAGVPGERAGAGAQRLPGLLARHHPALVLLCHGGNDMLGETSDADLERALRAMLEATHASGAQAVLLAVPRPGLILRPAPVYERLASEYGIPCERRIVTAVLADRRRKSDAIHPNAEGYRAIAEAVTRLLHRRGALPDGGAGAPP